MFRLPATGLKLCTAVVALVTLLLVGLPGVTHAQSEREPLPNIVLVHGAWADGSSWSGVIQRLQTEGYHVTAVQLALNSLADDAARTRQVLAAQEGPTILVGHSYGGAVITQLGPDAPNVVGLVYIAALAPDEGETLGALLEQGDPSPGNAHVYPDEQGYLWIDRDGYVDFFAPDVERTQAQVLAAVQKPLAGSIAAEAFGEPSWRLLPSWYLIAEDDQMIPPEAQHFMAARMEATISTIASSHAVMVSHPDEVAELIMTVAEAVSTPEA